MKIISAEVVDPRLSGQIERPFVLVNVENMTEPTTDKMGLSTIIRSTWYTQRYGAFTKCDPIGEQFSIGRFNNLFAGKLDPMVQIEIFDQATEQDIEGIWLLPLRRTRQLIRKFDPDWRLLMNDRDGQDGLVSWTPARIRNQRCCHIYPVAFTIGSPRDYCRSDAVGSVLMERVEMPMCERHLEDHNRAQARARAKTKA